MADWIIGVAGTIILILFGVIGYFYRNTRNVEEKRLNGLKTEDNKLYNISKSLERSINRLDKSTIKLESNITSQIEICGIRHTVLNKRMELNEDATKNNGEEINKIGKQIGDIKQKLIKI